MILEDQQDLSFPGDLPSQTLPLTQNKRETVTLILAFYCLLDISVLLSEWEIFICWVSYLGSFLSLSSLRSCSSRWALFQNR